MPRSPKFHKLTRGFGTTANLLGYKIGDGVKINKFPRRKELINLFGIIHNHGSEWVEVEVVFTGRHEFVICKNNWIQKATLAVTNPLKTKGSKYVNYEPVPKLDEEEKKLMRKKRQLHIGDSVVARHDICNDAELKTVIVEKGCPAKVINTKVKNLFLTQDRPLVTVRFDATSPKNHLVSRENAVDVFVDELVKPRMKRSPKKESNRIQILSNKIVFK